MSVTAEKIRVAVLDDYQNVALQYADWSRIADRVEVTVFNDHLDDSTALVSRLLPFDVVCAMRERTRFSAEVLSQLPRLKLIATSGPRNAAIDVQAALDRGITVCGTGAPQTGTPELTWLLILALARGFPAEQAALHSGAWQAGVGKDLFGSTLGIVGLGRIGSRVAAVAQAFGMRVIAWSPNLTPERAEKTGATCVTKDELFRSADFVTLSLQMAPATRNIIGPAELSVMKPTAFFINTSRASLVDEQALIHALTSGRIAGAGLDVFNVEPLPQDHPYRSLPNVILTPHIGYVTQDTYRQFYSEIVEDIEAWLDEKPIREVKVEPKV